MPALAKSLWTAALLGLGTIAPGNALGADRPAEAILKDLDSVKLPKLDVAKRNDAAYVREFNTKRQESREKRAALALELYKVAPNHTRIPDLMIERWASVRPSDPKIEETIKEIERVSSQTDDRAFKLDAVCVLAQIKLFRSRATGKPDLSGVEKFLKLDPKDPRGARLIYSAARIAKDDDLKTALQDRILNEFPDSHSSGMIKGSRRQQTLIGKPFELEFTDAIKGSTVSVKALKGKVVVIDFWATWCGPCVAEMPKMKELYAEYRDQGVEFIGVSLDNPKEQGGLDRLKKFVAKEKIAWPQYYQGKGWDSEFSTAWGINAIPCVFVVDSDGKLYSVKARGKLEEIIPELLKKKAGAAGAVAGGGE